MRLLVCDLGDVGTLCAVSLSAAAHHVVGVESNPARREAPPRGRSGLGERDLDPPLEVALTERWLELVEELGASRPS